MDKKDGFVGTLIFLASALTISAIVLVSLLVVSVIVVPLLFILLVVAPILIPALVFGVMCWVLVNKD